MEDIFRDTVKRYGLLKRKDKIILGVSGGPDSMALLHILCRIKNEFKLHLVCAHFNHLLRSEATQEEEFVKNVCADLKIKFISERKDVGSFFEGDSLEQTARNLRYDFFQKCSRQVKIKKILLAHHRDDLIETVLMRIIRGTGLRGLRGFGPRTKFRGLTVIRPLIDLSKKDIIAWLKEEKIDYCSDKSNFEDKFLRNRIRMKLLPYLKEFNPNIEDSLYNLAFNLSDDYDFIYAFCNEKYRQIKQRESKQSVYLDLAGLTNLAPAIFNHVIRIAIEDLKGNLRKIETKHIKEIKDLIERRPYGSVVDLPDGRVIKEEKSLIIQTLIL